VWTQVISAACGDRLGRLVPAFPANGWPLLPTTHPRAPGVAAGPGGRRRRLLSLATGTSSVLGHERENKRVTCAGMPPPCQLSR